MFRSVKASMWLVFLVCLFLLSVPVVLSAAGAREIELGEAFPQACADCHGSNPKYPLLGIRTSYEHSGHNLGYERELPNASYANGGGCQQCHTHEGFVEYVTTGSVDPKSYVSNPSQPGCFTCNFFKSREKVKVRVNPPMHFDLDYQFVRLVVKL